MTTEFDSTLNASHLELDSTLDASRLEAGTAVGEQNEQNDDELNAQLDVIAELAMNAIPNVRDVLYTYDPKMQKKAQVAKFNQFSKSEITTALEYLGVTKIWKDYLAQSCTLDLVERIQSLLPENCKHCNHKYTTKYNDPVLLPCRTCSQEPHRQCLARRLGMIENDMTRDAVYKAINPHNIAELHYLCPNCINTFFPQTEGMTKTAAKKIVTETAPMPNKQKKAAKEKPKNVHPSDHTSATIDEEGDVIHCSQIATGSRNPDSNAASPGAPPPTIIAPEQTVQPIIIIEDSSVTKETPASQQKAADPVTRQAQNDPKSKKKTCRDFASGTCKFGTSGRRDGECKFYHPRLCAKFLRNGTHQTRGCLKDKQCTDFHPHMCATSLRKRECFDELCPYWHVKFTKRRPINIEGHPNNAQIGVSSKPMQSTLQTSKASAELQTSQRQQPQENSENSTAHSMQPFLEKIHCLQECIEKAVGMMSNVTQAFMNFQQLQMQMNPNQIQQQQIQVNPNQLHQQQAHMDQQIYHQPQQILQQQPTQPQVQPGFPMINHPNSAMPIYGV